MTKSNGKSVIHVDPDIQSGTPVFAGTRVPAASLFDWLAGGSSLTEFLDSFPSVTLDQATTVLQDAKSKILAAAEATTIGRASPTR
jgi:uncharacterized protein (DUF433 family)